MFYLFFFFKQKTAYEMRISDWSSDVCSSDLRMTLQAEGILVTEAATAKEGVAKISMQKPDLVILDLGLPDRDGIEVIRQLRTWARLPILVLSARGEE